MEEGKEKQKQTNGQYLDQSKGEAELYAKTNGMSAEQFANAMSKQVLFNPSKNVGGARTHSKYSRDTIIKWLQAPSSNEKNLRDASIYSYMSSMHYQRLIKYFATLPLWQYIVYPKITGDIKNKDSVKKQYYKAIDVVNAMSIPQTGLVIAETVLREGIYFGVRHLGQSASFIQRLNPDICKIAYIQEGTPLFKVDMSKIPEQTLEFYPKEFTTMFRSYKASKIAWQDVPSDISVCVKFDLSIIDYSIPPFSAVLPGLYKIADAEDRHDVSEDQKNIKMIMAEAPIKPDGSPSMDWGVFVQYYNHLANQLPEGIGLGATPFKTEVVDFNKGGVAAEIDDISRTRENFWSSAGTSPVLHGSNNSAAGSMKLVIKTDESFMCSIIQQIERMVNAYLEQVLGGKIIFNISVLPTTAFNLDDYIARYKEGATLGVSKLYYMTALGVSQSNFTGMDFIEKEVLQLDENLRPLKSAYNTSSSDAGRPEKKEEDLEPSGVATREGDTNANR